MATVTVTQIIPVEFRVELEHDYWAIPNEEDLGNEARQAIENSLYGLDIDTELMTWQSQEFTYELTDDEKAKDDWHAWGDYQRDEERMAEIEYESIAS